MAYSSVTFIEHQVLTHDDMNNIIEGIDERQKQLVSGKNIKTINGSSILGEGNLNIIGDTGNLTINIELVPVGGYTIDGFLRPAGTENTSNYYCRTDFVDIKDCSSLIVTVWAGATSVSPVVWYDENKNYISGESLTTVTELVTNTYSPPENARYAIFSALKNKGSYVVANKTVSLDEYIAIKANSLAHKVYIAPNGLDTNDGLSENTPIATFAKAKEILSPLGELLFLDGDYENLSIDLSYFAKLTAVGRRARLLYPKAKITEAALVSGYTKVYSAAYSEIFSADIWQQDVADSATLISSDEKHPLQRERSCRLTNTRIYNVSGFDSESTETNDFLSFMENSELYLYYIDSTEGVIYFTAPNEDFASYPIVFPSSNTVSASTHRKVEISGLTFMYATVLTTGLSGVLNNVSVGYTNGSGCIRWDDTFDLILNNCEVCAGKNDGINGHTSGDITCYNCWGHDCADDGESDHETCHIVQFGGLYEYNGNGLTPASGASGEYYNVIARNNGVHNWTTDQAGTGFSAQGESATICCNGCLSTDNIIGFRATGNDSFGMFINCVSSRDTTPFSNGVQYNCIIL